MMCMRLFLGVRKPAFRHFSKDGAGVFKAKKRGNCLFSFWLKIPIPQG